MATVYLHIGTSKTGTTALQKFMRRNEEEMHKQGYCYPLMKLGIQSLYRDRNAQFLIYESIHEKRNPGETVAAHELRVKENGYRFVAEAAKKYPNIVLSDEKIWYKCQKEENFWKNTMEEFRKIGCDVKVIVYLRRQDLLIQSLWNQNVKMFRKTARPFSACIKDDYFDYFPLDYYAHLKKIEADVGKENLIVRPYERGRFGGSEHTIFSDFFESIGLTITDAFTKEGLKTNYSLEGNYLEIKRLINRLPEYRQMQDFLNRPVLNGSTCYTLRGENEKPNMFASRQEQAEYQAQFEESNRKVAEEYLGRKGEPLFYDEVKEAVPWSVKEDVMYRDVITVMTEAFCSQEQKIIRLEQKIAELKKEVELLKGSPVVKAGRKVKSIFHK